ncbi:hypothetical protein D9615_002367 [Tricholomella constricta]|uniref:Uncharacterized protein n=1 Tax=Tricholomella constricta TaxID=117010 RepID=A0A8H5HN49_9AGAR|nr:hypothetical protein D9615_002367 [Tricholomella constricta]
MRPCSSCAQTDSAKCHHRCHQPPLHDRVLIALIKASTAGDHDNGLASWKCADCLHRPPPDNPHIDLTLSSDDEEQVKHEETPLPLRTQPSVPTYNHAPTWIHRRHSERQTPDSWDRLARKKSCHNSKRYRKPTAKKSTATQDTFVFTAAAWLQRQKAALS